MTHQLLFRLVRYRPWVGLAAIATWILAFCLPLVTGLATRAVFDTLTGAAPVGGNVWLLIALLVVTALCDPLLMLAWMWVHITFEAMLENVVSGNLAGWLLDDAGTAGQRAVLPSTGELVSHVRDDVPGFTALVNEWYRLSGEGVFVLIALLIMAQIDLSITLFSFLPLATVVLLIHRLRTGLGRYWDAARTATSRITGFIGDLFGAVLAIKVAGAEQHAIAQMRVLNSERQRADLRHLVAAQALDAFGDGITIFSRGLVLILAAQAMQRGNFSIGDFALFGIYLDWMLMFPRRVGRLLAQEKQSEVALERLTALMPETSPGLLVAHPTAKASITSPAETATAVPLELLEVENLSYRYPGSAQGIEQVTFRVPRGSLTIITGTIGSGKTTLLEVLLGLRPMDGGTIRWNGMAVEQPARFFTPPQCAYTPQVPRLFSDTLRDNILLGQNGTAFDLEHAIHAGVLERDLAQLPQGLETLIGPRGLRLSGGQIQRAAAVRMFIRTPELLVFDDLSSALDAETEQQLWERIRNRKQGDTTILAVSHRRIALQQADQIIVLKAGRVVACGHLSEMMLHSEELRRLVGRETG